MDEIVKEFLIESNENLDRLDQELVQLESDPTSKELLGSIFRTLHSMKGSCGFLGFPRLEKVAHTGESLLVRLRDGEIRLNKEITSGLLATVDAVRQMLAAINATGQDGTLDYTPLIQRLEGLQSAEGSEPAPVEATDEETEPSAVAPPEEELPDSSKLGGLLLQRGQVTAEDLARALQQQELGRKRLGEILIAQGAARPEHVHSAQQTIASVNPEAAVETIRVGVTLLDRLMNLVGELVLARNQLLQFSGRMPNAEFQAVSQRINLIVTGLQEEVMRTRMQPISTVWNKFPRTVRDLALSCGKKACLEMEGQNTELDRTILETIKDPLTHLVRNCIDHGIEPPEVRQQVGKSVLGTVKLRAFHEGGQVNLEISDDGAGLNLERIRQKAVERRLMTHQHAAHAPESELLNLIFEAGFSTAEKVTNVSGRGVGMDVVKTNIEKIGGTIDVQSTLGAGTTVKIKLPLTLAIIPALIVISGGERFAIPQASLLELLRVEQALGGGPIEMMPGAPVYRLRGRLLPLVYLNRELQLVNSERISNSDSANIVVVQADGQSFGLVVDEIADTQEIVVKPLCKQLKGIAAYSGATIMGDGRIALILDVLGLAQRAGLTCPQESSLCSTEPKQAPDHSSLLLVRCGDERRVAIPLSVISRLEEFPCSAIERAGAQEVTQYRGEIIPLIRLSRILTSSSDRPESGGSDSRFPVVVYSNGGRSVGLVVDRILDIVDEELVVQKTESGKRLLGSCVVQGRVTDLLNVASVVAEVLPGFVPSPPG